MANLTANTVSKSADRGARAFVVKNSTTLYAGALVGTDTNGYLDNWADTAGLRFEGILKAKAVGDTSATPQVTGQVDTTGKVLHKAAVAGATTITAVNAKVYSTTGNPNDLTLTATTNVGAIGRVTQWHESSVCDVELFTPAEYLAAAGNAPATAGIYTLSIPIALAAITGAGDVVTGVVIPHAFKIISTQAVVETVVTTGSKAATLNLEIGTTNVTGGEVALTSANCTPLGARVAGAAITAANTGAAGDALSVEAASVTAFAEGRVILLVTIQNTDSL